MSSSSRTLEPSIVPNAKSPRSDPDVIDHINNNKSHTGRVFNPRARGHSRSRSETGSIRAAQEKKKGSIRGSSKIADTILPGRKSPHQQKRLQTSFINDLDERVSDATILKEGVLRFQGEEKHIYLTLMSDSMIFCSKVENKIEKGAHFSSFYLKGGEIIPRKSGLEGGFHLKSIFGQKLDLKPTSRMSSSLFLEWYTTLKEKTKQKPDAIICQGAVIVQGVDMLGFLDRNHSVSEASLQEFCRNEVVSTSLMQSTKIKETLEDGKMLLIKGPLVSINVTSRDEKIQHGTLMAQPDGFYAPHKFNPAETLTAPAFTFRVWYKYLRKKGEFREVVGFKNVKYNSFISRANNSLKMRSASKFGDTESFEISTPQWRVFRHGLAKSYPMALQLTEKGLLCWSHKEEDAIISFFSQEIVGGSSQELERTEESYPLSPPGTHREGNALLSPPLPILTPPDEKGESLLSPQVGSRSPALITTKDQKWDLFGMKGGGSKEKGVFGIEKYKEITPEQKTWDELSAFLVSLKLRTVKLPYEVHLISGSIGSNNSTSEAFDKYDDLTGFDLSEGSDQSYPVSSVSTPLEGHSVVPEKSSEKSTKKTKRRRSISKRRKSITTSEEKGNAHSEGALEDDSSSDRTLYDLSSNNSLCDPPSKSPSPSATSVSTTAILPSPRGNTSSSSPSPITSAPPATFAQSVPLPCDPTADSLSPPRQRPVKTNRRTRTDSLTRSPSPKHRSPSPSPSPSGSPSTDPTLFTHRRHRSGSDKIRPSSPSPLPRSPRKNIPSPSPSPRGGEGNLPSYVTFRSGEKMKVGGGGGGGGGKEKEGNVREIRGVRVCCPAFEGSKGVVKLRVIKRFNSRKLPHLIILENEEGQQKKFIFKEDDDISMDVAVMRLLTLANNVWERRNLFASLRTYNVVACEGLTGFCECVPGDTMLKFKAEAMDEQLGDDPIKWNKLASSIIGVMVTTAMFIITDRHHNNVMFTPDGDVCLIDLSASLGLKTPLDSALNINPVYYPNRFHKLRYACRARCQRKEFADQAVDLLNWDAFEEHIMAAYYAAYNDPSVKALAAQYNFKMPTPFKFHKFVNDRRESENERQNKEAFRNSIVSKMEESKNFNKAIVAITGALGAN